MTDCTRKTIFGNPACRFAPRFDLGPSQYDWAVHGYVLSENRARVARQYRKETYVRDVCTKCGRTIERSK